VIWWLTRLEAETSLSITRIMCFGERHNREHLTFQTISHMVLWGHNTFISFHRLFSLWWFIILYDIINFRITWLLLYKVLPCYSIVYTHQLVTKTLIICLVCVWNEVWWKLRQKNTLAKKVVFGVSKNHGKNTLENVQTCLCVLQTGNQTHT